MKKAASSAALLLATAACVRTNAALIDPTVHLAATCSSAVRLYTSPAEVLQPYQQVALLNSSGEASWSDEAKMIRSMRERAAEVGANGIILSGIDEPSALAKVAGDIARTGTVRKGKAVAIYVPADAARSQATCATEKKTRT